MQLNQALLGSFRETVENTDAIEDLDDVVSEMPDNYEDALSDEIEEKREELESELTETELVAALDQNDRLREAALDHLVRNDESDVQNDGDSGSDSEDLNENEQNPDVRPEKVDVGEENSDLQTGTEGDESPDSGAEDEFDGDEAGEDETGEKESEDENGEEENPEGEEREEAEDSISITEAAEVLREAEEITDEEQADVLKAVVDEGHVASDATLGTLRDSAESLGAEVSPDASLDELVTAIDEAARNPEQTVPAGQEPEVTTDDLMRRLNQYGKF